MTSFELVCREPDSASAASSDHEIESRLREVADSVLDGDQVEIRISDVFGGGDPCQIADCPRVAVQSMCSTHTLRWNQADRPALAGWQPGPPLTPEKISLTALPARLRLEIAYGLARSRSAEDLLPMQLSALRRVIATLATSGMTSLSEHPETLCLRDRSLSVKSHQSRYLRSSLVVFTIDELDRLRGICTPEHEYRLDVWRFRRIGSADISWSLDFRPIDQPWLRETVKKFVRWRNETGHSASGMHRDSLVLSELGKALTDCAGQQAQPEQLDRAVISRLLTRYLEAGYAPNGRRQRLSTVKRFFIIARQHDWIPDVPARTSVYSEDFPPPPVLAPRGLSPFVMAQIEDQANLDRIKDQRWRLLFPLLIETGLRLNDALHLPCDCLTYDQQQAPYLRYHNRKMKREALVPISQELADAIIAHARSIREQYSPEAILFPTSLQNPRGTRTVKASSAYQVLRNWVRECGIVDEMGAPARVTPHQFRHTLGTALINKDVPQEVVRRILDHSSAEMTAHYARLHDSTVRRHWERARKVDINGNPVAITTDSPLADAEWSKQHLARATQALPNGYCGLPLQQSCPHANACLTCPVFITTPEFLPQHREQLELTRGIIERAQQRGQLRLVEMNQRTADNLVNIITGLESPAATNGSEPNAS